MGFEIKHVGIYRVLAAADTNAAWLQLVATTIPGVAIQFPAVAAGTALNTSQVYTLPMFDLVRYTFAPGAGYTGQTTITFQELGLDGGWRNMNNPAPLNLANIGSTTIIYQGVIDGPLLGIRIFLQGIASGNIVYSGMLATLRSGT